MGQPAKYLDTPENREIVLRTIYESFGLTREQMISRSKYRVHCLSRAIAAKVFREQMGLTFNEIGKILGRPGSPKHHSSVMHMVRLVGDLIWTKEQLFVNMWELIQFKLSMVLREELCVLVFIPTEDEGGLVQFLIDKGYDYEVK